MRRKTMPRTAAQPPAARWPAWWVVLTQLVVAGIGVLVPRAAGVAAAQVISPESEGHAHPGGQGHDGLVGSDVRYFLVNVEISDAGLQPSTVFIPAGRPVQLVLRGRDRTEHHYRVVGLVPDELSWVAAAPSAMADDVSDDDHAHHNSTFVQSRDASPSGIRPTGDEVHAYVSPAETADVVLFSATQIGTFVVRCDLHAEDIGKLVVFDGAGQLTASGTELSVARENALSIGIATGDAVSRAGANPSSLAAGNPLSVELSRDLGSVEYPGASRVRVQATYAPPAYEAQILSGSSGMAKLEPDRYVAVLLTEGVPTGELPGTAEPPDLYLSGTALRLIDSKVTTELPQQRATLYRFARDGASGTGDQMMTLRLPSGQEATWDLSSSRTGGWNWVVPAIFAGGLGLFGWLVWMMLAGSVRKVTTR